MQRRYQCRASVRLASKALQTGIRSLALISCRSPSRDLIGQSGTDAGMIGLNGLICIQRIEDVHG